MPSLVFEAHDADVIAARFKAKAATAGMRTSAITRQYGYLLLRRVQYYAPKRSGLYASRINGTMVGTNRFSSQFTVYSPDVFARRLELGFVGEDALNRHYSQPPQPHFRRGLDEIGPEYLLALGAEFSER